MNRVKSLVAILALVPAVAIAQNRNSAQESFQEFRKNMLSSYSSFRESILKDYDKFLENAWTEYDTSKGEKRDATPKPKTVPVAPERTTPEQQEKPVVVTPTPKPAPQPVAQPKPAPQPAPEPAPTPRPAEKAYKFDFYGLPMSIPQIDVNLNNRLASTADFAYQWRELNNDERSKKLIRELSELAKKMNLNDYLTYELVKHYVNSRYQSAHSSARSSLIHFILANMGYDARVALTTSGKGIILLPFTTEAYNIIILNIDNKRYYAFTDEKLLPGERVATCDLPANAYKGETMSLQLKPLNIPEKPQPFDLQFGDLHITGTVNANLFPIIYRYPNMGIGDYAQSMLQPEVRDNIVRQVKEQLSGQSKLEAVNHLLQFTQSAFEYATDEEAHGFEKPYFFEEMLYYPKCDCEDRAIFYTYLLWNALGVENQLITYPGHESAAVTLDAPVEGTSYKYRGKTFYISDPTYTGAVTGMCIPDFQRNNPGIDFHYKN